MRSPKKKTGALCREPVFSFQGEVAPRESVITGFGP